MVPGAASCCAIRTIDTDVKCICGYTVSDVTVILIFKKNLP